MSREAPDAPAPDERVRRPWSRSDRRLPRTVLRPLQSFLATEASGGIILLGAGVVALLWANSPLRDSYEDLWNAEFTIRLGRWVVSGDLRHWVNDGLMALFFLVVGLEIKREVLTGELRAPRAAALPVIAAVGGMIVPAAFYLAFNAAGPGSRGWGIPMATDIAFALGVLTIAAGHAPASLKPFLLTLAIVDDIGAIAVIALFYSGGITWGALAVAVGLCLLIVGLQRIQVRATAVYVLLGASVWLATLQSGVHATIAGVVLGLLTPAVPFQRPRAVSDEAHRVADQTVDDPEPPDADAHHWLHLTGLSREAVSPLARVESVLHPWTSYLIVPAFALANAGVPLSFGRFGEAMTSGVGLGVLLGLVLGKVVGITLASLIVVRMGIVSLPHGLRWWHVVGVAQVAGIGFTVSIFITDLAFPITELQEVAKVAILAASLFAGLAGAAIFRLADRSVSEASTG